MATYTPTSSSGTAYSSLNVGDIIQGNYTGNVIPVTLPAGSYKLECYGAQGGYGRTGTQSTSTGSTSLVCPSSSDFTVTEIYGGNSALYGSSYYLMYLGKGYMSSSQTGYITVRVNTAGYYQLTITYQTESNYDVFSINVNGSAYYTGHSGDNTTSPTIYSSVYLQSGSEITMQYSKDGSVDTTYDFVSIEILKEQTTAGTSYWSLGTQYGGGYGGYSVGTLNLTTSTTLYLQIGGMGGSDSSSTPSQTNVSGGYNGGGSAGTYVYNGTATYAGGGGGASDIRIGSDSLYARVIVAGGGGGSAGNSDVTNKQGGGTTGACSGGSSYYGTQTAAGTNGGFGTGANATGSRNYKYGAGGGGGGWYGGGANTSVSDSSTSYRTHNGGGSGYVYTSSTASNYPAGCTLNSNYYLTNASTSTNTRTGNGLIKITMLTKPASYKMWVKTASSTWKPASKIYVKTAASTWKEGVL